MLLQQFLLRAALTWPEKVAFVSRDERRTYADLFEETCRLANGLVGLGVGEGTRVAVLLANSPRYFTSYYAGCFLAATVVPINPRLTPREIQHILTDSEAEILIFDPEFEEQLSAVDLRPGILLVATGPTSVSTAEDYQRLVSEGATAVPDHDFDPETIALQLYTSGTTGQPKGAMVSHRALYINALTTNCGQGIGPDDTFLSVTPLGHAAAGVRIFNLACAGATHITTRKFDAGEVLTIIGRERITTTVFVPTVMRLLMDHPDFDRADLRSLRLIVYGAAPSPVPLLEEAIQRFPGDLLQGYGLTEGCPYLIRLLPLDHVVGSAKLASIGQAAESVLAQIVDEDLNAVPDGQIGQLAVRSPKSMTGYWRRPEDTAKMFRNGWLLTGDLGRMEDGYVYLAGRKNDMIVSGGFNVYPQEIEDVIAVLPGVRDVAVAGAPNEKWGETPVAFVVLDRATGLDTDAILAHCKKNLAGYKMPSAVRILDVLPRNSTGKVLRSELV